MTNAPALNFYDENAWLIGEDEPCPALSTDARRIRETRIAAAVLKRRWKLLVHWRNLHDQMQAATVQAKLRPVSLAVPDPVTRRRRAAPDADVTIGTDLPRHLPVLRQEIALWRSFLADEIHAILFGSQ